ncbi:hypothetical protein [Bradyrhizobium neotropicale]|uniref:hypothetical protein n=1 Tax=Bradyrhizobium neotropicale TaxID=1497615 RepID=UPI00289EC82B|nr:hypothetical protein [Bradyrhizobium neotropicale]
MKRILFSVHLVVAAAMLAGIGHSRAEDGLDSAKAAAFDKRIFAGPFAEKTYACFVRGYDANHLAQRPKQQSERDEIIADGGERAGGKNHQPLLPPWN